MDTESIAPPFYSSKYQKTAPLYVWYSWHPLYPRWSRSCWKSPLIEEAIKKLYDPACGLSLYHNKLIRDDGTCLEEIMNAPCKEMEKWNNSIERVKENQKN